MRCYVRILACLIGMLAAANPRFAYAAPGPEPLAEKRSELGTLVPASAQQDWGVLAINKSVMGNTLRIGSREFAAGLGTHADSRITYDIEGAYDRFEAWVGVDAEMASYPQASVQFQVLGDGKELFKSDVMRADTPAVRVDVPVVGIRTLTLIVGKADSGIDCDHADWADAALTGKAETAPQHPVAKYKIKGPGIELGLTSDGQLAGINTYAVRGETRLMSCVTQGEVTAVQLRGGGMEFRRPLHHDPSGDCTLVERFIPRKDSVRWEIEISGAGDPWTTGICTRLRWPATAGTRFWTAWSDPGPTTAAWHDPLATRPLSGMNLPYGGLSGQVGEYITLPIATLIEPSDGFGLSLAMSPEDTTLDAALSTTADGGVTFTRMNNRISAEHPVHFALDIVRHEPDIRSALGWMVRRYPRYFEPPNSKADEIAGLGAYSFYEGDLDVPKLKKMGFRVNWKASYDFPYMGMFIPPVGDAEEWKPLSKRSAMSIRELAGYSRQMRDDGFYVLNYFNCNEIGNKVEWPAPPRKAVADKDLWKDTNDFVYYQVGGAWLRNRDGAPMFSWVKCVVADPGDESYHRFLVDQARRHVEKLPMSSGICIDRLDWMRLYNSVGDDGVSWIDGHPSRFMMTSWNSLMSEIGPIMHSAGKVIFVNTLYKRLDAMRQVDGIYDEFGHRGSCLNASAFMALRKPLIVWTSSEADLKPDPDAFFQRHLYMGAFPTAPVPGNDHTINPSRFADKWYLDYGPLFDQLRGRKWVLAPQAVEMTDGTARANVFEVGGGYVVPVVFGGTEDSAQVTLRNLPGLKKGVKLTCRALYPGNEQWVDIPASMDNGKLTLDVPLKSGCAMVRLEPGR